MALLIFAFILEYLILTKTNFHKLNFPEFYKGNDFRLENGSDYKKTVNLGSKIAKQSTIIFCGLARNIESVISKNISKLEVTGNYFKDYRIVIFENDSSDKTREIISEKGKENPKIILLSCENIPGATKNCKINSEILYEIGTFSKKRMKKMAFYRNQYLNYIKTNFHHFDYSLVIDMDFEGLYNNDGIFNSLSFKDWDMISANGRFQLPGTLGRVTMMYDALAYISLEGEFSEKVNIYDAFIKFLSMNEKINSCQTKLLPVTSAFNGLTLYKMNSFIKGKYDSFFSCEHIDFNKSLIDKKCNKFYINPNFICYMGIQGPRDKVLKSLFI